MLFQHNFADLKKKNLPSCECLHPIADSVRESALWCVIGADLIWTVHCEMQLSWMGMQQRIAGEALYLCVLQEIK